MGRRECRHGGGRLRAALPQSRRLSAGPRCLRAGRLCRGRCGLPPAGAHRQRVRLAFALRPQHVPPAPGGGAGRLHARLHRAARALLPRRSRGRRHQQRVLHPRQFRPPPGGDRRHDLRRRDQEVGLLHPQLSAAGTRRAAHALLGQHRAGRRYSHLLRPLRHRQDHPLRRPRPQPDRRRRARLVAQGRLQLRGAAAMPR